MDDLKSIFQSALSPQDEHRFVFIVGAGISADSGVPLFSEFSRRVVQGNIPNESPRGVPDGQYEMLVDRITDVVRPERIMSIIRKWIGPDATNWYKLLEGEPDGNHDLMAALIANGNHVVTPNLDRAIEKTPTFRDGRLREIVSDSGYERASEQFPSDGVLWKYHGSLGTDGGRPRATVEDVSTAMSRHKSATIGRLLRDFPVVVLGYSGNDHFSLQPLLATSESAHPLYWIAFKRGPKENPPCNAPFRRFDVDTRRKALQDALDLQAEQAKSAGATPPAALDRAITDGRLAETLSGRGSELYEAEADSSRIAHELQGREWLQRPSRQLHRDLLAGIPSPSHVQRCFIWSELLAAAGANRAAAESLPPLRRDASWQEIDAMIAILRQSTRFDEILRLVREYETNSGGRLSAPIRIAVANTIRLGPPHKLDEKLRFVPILEAIEADNAQEFPTRMAAASQLALLRYAGVTQQRDPPPEAWTSLEMALKTAERYLNDPDAPLVEKAVAQNSLGYPRIALGDRHKDLALLERAKHDLEQAIETNQLLGYWHKLFQNWRTISVVHQKVHQMGPGTGNHRENAIKCARRALLYATSTGSDTEVKTALATIESSEALKA